MRNPSSLNLSLEFSSGNVLNNNLQRNLIFITQSDPLQSFEAHPSLLRPLREISHLLLFAKILHLASITKNPSHGLFTSRYSSLSYYLTHQNGPFGYMDLLAQIYFKIFMNYYNALCHVTDHNLPIHFPLFILQILYEI